jgi:hypothetical protein
VVADKFYVVEEGRHELQLQKIARPAAATKDWPVNRH